MAVQHEKAQRFRALHEGKPFVIPNPWDAGSARMLAALGFPALATTSSGFAFTLGRPDGGATLEELLSHVGAVDAATTLPVSVDLEHGHGPEPGDAGQAITRAAAAGAVGGSIEDWDPAGRLFPLPEAVARIVAARAAADALDFPFTLTARAENHIHGNPDLVDTIARLRAYEEAGADVLYAPGLATIEAIAEVCGALTRPVNVLGRPDLRTGEIFAAGAQRVSLGGALAWTAIEAAAAAAEAIRDSGDMSLLGSPARIAAWLAD